MLRKVKGLPITTDFTGMLSWQNQFDGNLLPIKWCFSLLSVVSLSGFEIGYAYETPTVSSLSQLNLKTHEIVLRINLGQGDQTTKTGPESRSSPSRIHTNPTQPTLKTGLRNPNLELIYRHKD